MVDIDEKLNVSELLGLYGKLLTPHQAEMLRLYYDCDISLFEISEQFGISRQAVRDALLRGAKTLKDIDGKLQLKRIIDSTLIAANGAVESIKSGNTDGAIATLGALIANLEE